MAGFGESLRQARAHKGVTLREAEQTTRINRHHLAALEDENFTALPPMIYQRGIVRNYAAYLDLDPSKMLGMFEEAHGITATTSRNGVASAPPIDMPSHWAPNFAIIGFAVVLSAILFAWGYSIYVTPGGEDPSATVATTIDTPLSSTIEPRVTLPATPAPPTAVAPTQAAEPAATTEEAAVEQVSGRQDQNSEDNQAAVDVTEAPVEEVASDEQYITGMTVVANDDIELTVVIDGQVAFDGELMAGESTEQFVGTSFEFTTSSGVNTLFGNACGDDPFLLGDEELNATYAFEATEKSCKL